MKQRYSTIENIGKSQSISTSIDGITTCAICGEMLDPEIDKIHYNDLGESVCDYCW